MPKQDITLLKSPTANALIQGLKSKGYGSGNAGIRSSHKPLEPFTAKVVTNDDDGYYTVQEVIWDDSSETAADHEWVDAIDDRQTTAREISGADDIEVDEVFIIYPDISKEGFRWIFQQGGSGGSLIWGVSQDAINTFGQSGTEPGEPLEVLEEGVFYLSTPWGTRVAAPDELYGFWNKIGDNYYFPVRDIFIEIGEVYPSSGNVTNYKIKFAKSAGSLTLGDTSVSGSLPTGAEATLATYDNASSSSDARSVFNGNVYDCSYDPAQNLFFIDHPVVG